MAILEVLTFPNPILRRKSMPIEKVTDEHKKLASDMLETMYDHHGIGLAAPQVGQLERLIVIDIRPRENGRYDLDSLTELEKKVPQPIVLLNPEILQKDGITTYQEGCLSVPSYFEEVKRAEHIVVRYLNLEGLTEELEIDGLLAICIQHEIDHLDGKLFFDRLSTIKSNRIKNKIKKFGYPEKDGDKKEDESSEKEEVLI